MERKALGQYLRKLKQALTCSRPNRERLLSQGQRLLEDFWGENPEGGYEALVTAFGPPEVFAGEMLGTLDQEELTKTRTRRKWLLRGVALLVAVVLALCAVFYAVKWYQAKEIINGDFRIVQDDPIVVPENEYNSIFGLESNSPDE